MRITATMSADSSSAYGAYSGHASLTVFTFSYIHFPFTFSLIYLLCPIVKVLSSVVSVANKRKRKKEEGINPPHL